MTKEQLKYKTSAQIICACATLFVAFVVGTVLLENWPK
jgi:hypothetical protein